ncbi:MAG: nucleoside triphosphate pyrophosphohydrolase [Bacteroidales bacterium]|jgi:XTP/dITP diphosphohydrolase|nr:nucleoside triphosphate pyrophosphohydrolase [Bacteroidales bacterium]
MEKITISGVPEKRKHQLEEFNRLLDILEELRVKCPWDKVQTIDSLRPLTIEETFELSDAIVKKDYSDMPKELGDILMHIIFYAMMGDEQHLFGLENVIDELCTKLIYRHPHVFSTVKVKDAGEVLRNWEQLKTKEKDGNKTVLSGVPDALPSIIKAYRMQDKARGVGFDWHNKSDVWGKVKEEIGEFKEEMEKMSEYPDGEIHEGTEKIKAAEGELGDLLFSIINAARLYKLNPDTALESTNRKFKERFTYMEKKTIRSGKPLTELSLKEMEALWKEAKEKEKINNNVTDNGKNA